MGIPLIDVAIMGIFGVNIVITLVLAGVYFRNFRKIGSKFTLGLMFFALAFMFGNIVNLYFYSHILSTGDFNLTFFQLSVSAFQMIALILLLYVTWK